MTLRGRRRRRSRRCRLECRGWELQGRSPGDGRPDFLLGKSHGGTLRPPEDARQRDVALLLRERGRAIAVVVPGHRVGATLQQLHRGLRGAARGGQVERRPAPRVCGARACAVRQQQRYGFGPVAPRREVQRRHAEAGRLVDGVLAAPQQLCQGIDVALGGRVCQRYGGCGLESLRQRPRVAAARWLRRRRRLLLLPLPFQLGGHAPAAMSQLERQQQQREAERARHHSSSKRAETRYPSSPAS
jgi:hypothetical protein